MVDPESHQSSRVHTPHTAGWLAASHSRWPMCEAAEHTAFLLAPLPSPACPLSNCGGKQLRENLTIESPKAQGGPSPGDVTLGIRPQWKPVQPMDSQILEMAQRGGRGEDIQEPNDLWKKRPVRPRQCHPRAPATHLGPAWLPGARSQAWLGAVSRQRSKTLLGKELGATAVESSCGDGGGSVARCTKGIAPRIAPADLRRKRRIGLLPASSSPTLDLGFSWGPPACHRLIGQGFARQEGDLSHGK